MPPISSIFSRNNMNRPVSSVGNLSGAMSAKSSALGSELGRASTSVFHEAHQTTGGSTSIFHPAGTGQHGTSSIAHIQEHVEPMDADESMRDTIHDDLRYRHMRQVMRENANAQTKEQRVLERAGTGKSFGSTKRYIRRFNTMVRSMPAKYKNLSSKDKKYFVDLVKTHAKRLPTGTGFGITTRKKMKREVYKDMRSHVISKEDRKDFKTFIDQLPR